MPEEPIAIITQSLSSLNWTACLEKWSSSLRSWKFRSSKSKACRLSYQRPTKPWKPSSLRVSRLAWRSKESSWPTNRLQSGLRNSASWSNYRSRTWLARLKQQALLKRKKWKSGCRLLRLQKRLLLQKLSKSSRIKTLFRIVSISYRLTCQIWNWKARSWLPASALRRMICHVC